MTSTNTNRLWTGNSAPLSTNARSRPWTGHSRPTTARPQTAASIRNEGSYVIAVLEGRGVSREVGIAALDRDTGHVMLVQVRLFLFCNDNPRLTVRLTGCRLPDICQVPTSDASSQPMSCPDPGYVLVCFWRCVSASRKTIHIDIAFSTIYTWRVPWCSNRPYGSSVLERRWG